MSHRLASTLSTLVAVLACLPASVVAQAADAEVRQLVTFKFLPGRAAEAIETFRTLALPLYAQDEAMRSFRAMREVESPVPLDLVVVSSFDGMAGMDESNAALRGLRTGADTGIGDFYAAMGELIDWHDDQFVEMIGRLSNGDPYAAERVALISYRAAAGRLTDMERRLAEVAALDADRGTPSATGRFLVSDGWDFLRIVGLSSLGDYHSHARVVEESAAGTALRQVTAASRQILLAPVPELFVR